MVPESTWRMLLPICRDALPIDLLLNIALPVSNRAEFWLKVEFVMTAMPSRYEMPAPEFRLKVESGDVQRRTARTSVVENAAAAKGPTDLGRTCSW